MKRCPACGRDYNDDSLSFCLDDGAELLFGPKSFDGPHTAILHDADSPDEAATRRQIYTTDQSGGPAGLTDSPRDSKGIDRKLLVPILLAVIVLGGYFAYRYLSWARSGMIDSIAVMPFANESGNVDVDYLSDGMTETLISSLSQVPNLSVKGRSSVFRYKGKDISTTTLGEVLGVQAILYGRVVQRSDQLTLSLELLDAATENVIWSGRYERRQADLVSLQTEIARDVSQKLKTKLSGEDAAKVEKKYTADPEAYRLYLQGRFNWNKRTVNDIKRGIEYLNQAIAVDPAFALAYAGLADAWVVLPNYTDDPLPDESYEKARRYAKNALELDPVLTQPHATLGVVLHEFDWNQAEAENEFKRAIELDPNYPTAHQWYGEYLMNMLRFEESEAELKRAIELDPFSPIINLALANLYHYSKRTDEGIAQYQKLIEIEPNFVLAHANLSDLYFSIGKYGVAMDELKNEWMAQGRPPEQVNKDIEDLKEAYRTSGGRGFGQKRLEIGRQLAKEANSEITHLDQATFELVLGNKEAALAILEKIVEDGPRYANLVRLRSVPQWEPLWNEPRFKVLIRRIGLPE